MFDCSDSLFPMTISQFIVPTSLMTSTELDYLLLEAKINAALDTAQAVWLHRVIPTSVLNEFTPIQSLVFSSLEEYQSDKRLPR
jgi:hypothetical protein